MDALRYAPGNTICRVAITGDLVRGDDKLVGRRREVLWITDAEQTLRKFARMCAKDVLHLWNAPPVVIEYLNTGDEALRVVAHDAARTAARAAARAARAAARAARAAGDAAWAARAAARDAAWDAAWDAARAATHAAARAAGDAAWDTWGAAWDTWDAARDAQNRRLGRMLMKLQPKEKRCSS
jgi:hypothetical protein